MSPTVKARQDLRDFLDRARGCHVELIMKDISTVRYHPERLWEWARIAAEVVEEAGDRPVTTLTGKRSGVTFIFGRRFASGAESCLKVWLPRSRNGTRCWRRAGWDAPKMESPSGFGRD